MSEVWVWYSSETSGDSVKLLTAANRLLLPGEQLWAVCVEEEPPALLPPCQGVRFCRACVSPGCRGELLSRMAKEHRPEIILFPSGYTNSTVAAAAAAYLNTGLSADCTALRREGRLLVMHRPAFGGGVVADIVCEEARPQMATVRPDVLPSIDISCAPSVSVQEALEDSVTDSVELLSRLPALRQESITRSDIIVAGGLGIGSRENFHLIEQLARALGGMPGASRAAVDAGFAPWRYQVGQTGNTVHPKLYLAFGISGSIQHIMGMHGSEVIVAVNTDPDAPIFEYADYAVIGDWKQTALLWLEHIQKPEN